ncbi:hypothetical protein Franean1_3095 [Parafrankia sp. EAN1pec]|uniref:hypothetical protein n=1 Tax=Parafrankia sp. (strain EAN1pec) TaxID=298653 RepID=UPI000054496B|nr:hypothetical protein Franean1_3095 [Frankia sp. EAN1pec]
MEQQEAQLVEQQLRQNWRQVRYRILDQFAEVNTSDLDAALNVDDLVQRIADRSHFSQGYVETRLRQLVGAAPAGGTPAQPAAEQPTAQAEQPAAQAEPAAEQPAERFGQRQPFGGA